MVQCWDSLTRSPCAWLTWLCAVANRGRVAVRSRRSGFGLLAWVCRSRGHRPRAFRSALSEACASRRFFLYASLRTLLGAWLASLSAMSCWICSINSGLIRRRGLMPLALRRLSEYWRHHARCFSAQVAQRVCPCMAGRLQRQSSCSLRSWWARAGFLGFDGRRFAEGGLGCRRGEGFDRLD